MITKPLTSQNQTPIMMEIQYSIFITSSKVCRRCINEKRPLDVNENPDELACDANVNATTNISNVGSIHLYCDDDLLKNDELHLVAIEFHL
jgi:hypothetical protein